jgi:transitional endoplasmic reticulum ATPase
MPLDPEVDLSLLASKTEGYSGADIAALCREAAMEALRKGADRISSVDFSSAMEKVPPSVTPDMEKWYLSFARQLKRVTAKIAPPPHIA